MPGRANRYGYDDRSRLCRSLITYRCVRKGSGVECTYWKFGAIVRQEKQRHDAGFVSTVEVFSVAASSPCCPHAQKTALGTFLDTPVVLTLARSLDEVINNIRNWLMGI